MLPTDDQKSIDDNINFHDNNNNNNNDNNSPSSAVANIDVILAEKENNRQDNVKLKQVSSVMSMSISESPRMSVNININDIESMLRAVAVEDNAKTSGGLAKSKHLRPKSNISLSYDIGLIYGDVMNDINDIKLHSKTPSCDPNNEKDDDNDDIVCLSKLLANNKTPRHECDLNSISVVDIDVINSLDNDNDILSMEKDLNNFDVISLAKQEAEYHTPGLILGGNMTSYNFRDWSEITDISTPNGKYDGNYGDGNDSKGTKDNKYKNSNLENTKTNAKGRESSVVVSTEELQTMLDFGKSSRLNCLSLKSWKRGRCVSLFYVLRILFRVLDITLRLTLLLGIWIIWGGLFLTAYLLFEFSIGFILFLVKDEKFSNQNEHFF